MKWQAKYDEKYLQRAIIQSLSTKTKKAPTNKYKPQKPTVSGKVVKESKTPINRWVGAIKREKRKRKNQSCTRRNKDR